MTRQTQTRKGWIFFPLQAGLLHHWVKGFKQWDDNNGRDFCGSSLSPCFLPFVLIWLFLCFCDISDTNKDKHRRRRNVTSYHFFHYFNFFGYYHKVCRWGRWGIITHISKAFFRYHHSPGSHQSSQLTISDHYHFWSVLWIIESKKSGSGTATKMSEISLADFLLHAFVFLIWLLQYLFR